MPISEMRVQKDLLCTQGDENVRRAINVLKSRDVIVIFGAGFAGKKMKGLLETHGRPVQYFTDSDQAKWNTAIDGTPVIPPDSIKTLGDPTVVIAAWDRETIRDDLIQRGGGVAALRQIFTTR